MILTQRTKTLFTTKKCCKTLLQKCKLSPPGVISCQTIAIVNNEIYLYTCCYFMMS